MLKVNNEKIIIWNLLPHCILDYIYSKIYFCQNPNLISDIKSYHYTLINILRFSNLWDILWFLILEFDNNNIIDEIYFKMYLKNSNPKYWIRKYINRISIKQRSDFIYKIFDS